MTNKIVFNWEKIGVYVAFTAAFLTVITYIADIKERVRALEVKQEYNEKILDLQREKKG
jgi:hypothetical protein